MRETVHACPPEGSALMPCCGRNPLELLADRMTSDPDLVMCRVLIRRAALRALADEADYSPPDEPVRTR